jgi:hypothetical protein
MSSTAADDGNGLNSAHLAGWFRDSRVRLPPAAPAVWSHVLTGATLAAGPEESAGRELDLQAVFSTFPVALLAARAPAR